MNDSAVRYTEYAFPPYTYVPGMATHPMKPGGHGCPGPHYVPVPMFQVDWRHCAAYLWGIDLFNAGFYWEAHEAWEGIWRGLGDDRSDANFCKGLIKLAAAGVKIREGKLIGVQRHAHRSAELFRELRAEFPARCAGLQLANLQRCAQLVETNTDAACLARFACGKVMPQPISIFSTWFSFSLRLNFD